MKLTLKKINEAKQYLSDSGYGTGSNFTVNIVANLMAEWAVKKQQFKKDVCKKQREICADKARTKLIDLPNKDYLIYDVDKYSILNAPEPE